MNDTSLGYMKPRTDAEYEAEIDGMLAEMQRINKNIQQTDAKIERLKIETRQIFAQTEVRWTQLEAQLRVMGASA